MAISLGVKKMQLIKEPEVKILDYTGMGQNDPLWAAKKLIYTKLTRLEQSQNTWDKIFSMSDEEITEQLSYVRDSVRSSWEFVTITFQLKLVTRGFTHQMVRTRTASYAQQSQRVVDMTGFDFGCGPVIKENPEMFAIYEQCMNSINESYKKLIELKAPAQDARGVLPTAVGTSIIIEMNLRTLADLAGKRDNPRAEGEYFIIFKKMAESAIKELPWIESFLYPPRLQTPALDAILTRLRGNRSPVELKELNDAMKELDRLKGIWG